jgi:hypothetical protein
LNPAEFDLFLDLLGEALAAQTSAEKPVEAISSDGTLRITLCPTPDGARAVIPTSTGSFAGRDHFITIRKVLPEGHAEIQSAVWGPARNPTAQPTEVEAV